MKIVGWNNLDSQGRRAVLARPAQDAREDLLASTREIVETVRRDGDAALRAYTLKFDKVELHDLAVSKQEFAAARGMLTSQQIAAIERAIENVRAFHKAQLPTPLSLETMPGVRCER